MKTLNIIALSGSLRKESYTNKLLKAFANSAPKNIQLTVVDISKLPLFNEDLEAKLPKAVSDFHQQIKAADAVIFGTPEYNRSYTPAIKNAVDWGSRPEGKNSWEKLPAAVVGCSPYSLGAFGAVNHLRQVLLYVDLYVMQQPEFYLSFAADKMDKKGNITDAETQKFIDDFWNAFTQWIANFKK